MYGLMTVRHGSLVSCGSIPISPFWWVMSLIFCLFFLCVKLQPHTAKIWGVNVYWRQTCAVRLFPRKIATDACWALAWKEQQWCNFEAAASNSTVVSDLLHTPLHRCSTDGWQPKTGSCSCYKWVAGSYDNALMKAFCIVALCLYFCVTDLIVAK